MPQKTQAKETSDAPGPQFQSSPVSFWKTMAAIPLVLAVIIFGLEMATNGPDTTEAPGLDYGTGSMFDKIATRYDTINRVLAMNMDIGWRRTMTSRIGELLSQEDESNSAWKILDMATGTADVALQLVDDLERFQKTSSLQTTVLGLDPSENMLSVGRQKIQAEGLESRIVLETADARDLSGYYDRTSDDSQKFDAATMAFGIRNVVPNRKKALCEIHKLLKPNGVLAILEFSKPTQKHGIFGAAAGVFIQHVVPFVGGLLSGGAKKEYRHLQNSIAEFPSPEIFKKQLETLECPLRDDDDDVYFYVGNYAMEDVVHMNFGSVQLYIGRAAVKQKLNIKKADTKLPPISP